MSAEFEQDRDQVLTDVEAARNDLLSLIGTLSEADLNVGRRGSWSVRDVIRHVILGEWSHTRGIARLRGAEDPLVPEISSDASLADLGDALAASRSAHLDSVDGIEEDVFYRLAVPGGGQEWSVMSFLEGTADHDREHQAQIERLLGR